MFKKYPTIRSRIAHLVTPGSLSERAISIASIVLICGICWLDSKTHSDIRLRILYMFPLAMLALHVRRGRTCFLGFALVASCEATSLVSTHLPFATRFIEALVAITGFLLVVVLARAVRDNYLNLRLRSTTLEAAANGMVITDRQGTIVWANQAFSTMTGYSNEEVLGKNPRLLKSGEQPESYYDKLWSTISSGKVWKGEIVNRRKDGTTYTEEMTITPVTRDVGNPANRYFIAIKQDITESKRTQNALVASERRFRSLFENMLEGFAYCKMIFDDHGRPIDFVYLAVNAAFGKLTGLDNVVDKRFTEIIPEVDESQAELLERYGRVVRTGEPERFEIEVKALGIWFSISAYGAVNGCFVATFDNITERKQAEAALLFKTALLEAQAETTIDGILAVDESDHIVLANKQFGRNFEIPDELLSTRDDLNVLKHVTDKVEDPDGFIERVEYLNSHRDEKSRDELRFKNGKIFDRYSAPLVDSKGRYRGRIWYFRDITDRKLAEERVQFLAYYDAIE